MLDSCLCLCNSVYIFWKSLPVHFNASDNPVFETCNSFVCIIFSMPVEGHRHFVALHYDTVYWPFCRNIQPSPSCCTQKVPPIICQPPTKLRGVTHHNTECFLYRLTECNSCIAYKACIRRYLPDSLTKDASSCTKRLPSQGGRVLLLLVRGQHVTNLLVLSCAVLSVAVSARFIRLPFKCLQQCSHLASLYT